MRPLRERLRRAARWARAHPAKVRAAAVLVIGLLVASAFLAPFALPEPGARHLSAYADGARDLSAFLEVLDEAAGPEAPPPRALATSSYFLESIRDPERHVLFVFGVEKPYTAGETKAVLDFVAAGGTLILANDVGNANPLSKEFGVLFGDKSILDRESYRNDPLFPKVAVPFRGIEYEVVMNAPAWATIVDVHKVTVLAESSNESFLDVNGNGRIELDEQPGPFPLVMNTTYGRGSVVLVADTGLFMNEMLERSEFDNAAFARALLAEHAAGGIALIEESRHVAPPSSRAGDGMLRAFVLLTSTPGYGVGVGILAVGLAVAAALLTKGTEDWSVHVFDVGHVGPAPEGLGPTPERLQALAARAVSERYNIPFEYLESASVDEVARLTGDRELAAVAKGAERPKDVRAFYEKLIDPVPTQVTIQEVTK